MRVLRKNVRKCRLPVIFLFILAIALLAACGGGGSDSGQPPAPATSAPAQQSFETNDETTTAEGVRIIEVTAAFLEPRYRPDPIILKVGEAVQFRITSFDTQHTFTIDELGVDEKITQKLIGTTAVSQVVTPTHAGELRLCCRIHNGTPLMQGIVQVVE